MTLDELVSSIELLMEPHHDLLESFRLFIPAMSGVSFKSYRVRKKQSLLLKKPPKMLMIPIFG